MVSGPTESSRGAFPSQGAGSRVNGRPMTMWTNSVNDAKVQLIAVLANTDRIWQLIDSARKIYKRNSTHSGGTVNQREVIVSSVASGGQANRNGA